MEPVGPPLDPPSYLVDRTKKRRIVPEQVVLGLVVLGRCRLKPPLDALVELLTGSRALPAGFR